MDRLSILLLGSDCTRRDRKRESTELRSAVAARYSAGTLIFTVWFAFLCLNRCCCSFLGASDVDEGACQEPGHVPVGGSFQVGRVLRAPLALGQQGDHAPRGLRRQVHVHLQEVLNRGVSCRDRHRDSRLRLPCARLLRSKIVVCSNGAAILPACVGSWV